MKNNKQLTDKEKIQKLEAELKHLKTMSEERMNLVNSIDIQAGREITSYIYDTFKNANIELPKTSILTDLLEAVLAVFVDSMISKLEIKNKLDEEISKKANIISKEKESLSKEVTAELSEYRAVKSFFRKIIKGG